MTNKEHPPSNKEIRDLVNSQKGLNDWQKKELIKKSEQTWFKQYVKNSDKQLKKLVKTVKKQIKQDKGNYFAGKAAKEDRRGVEPKKQKGTTKPQLNKKLKENKVKPVKLTPEQKTIMKKQYRKAYNQRPDVKEANRIRKAEAYRKKKEGKK